MATDGTPAATAAEVEPAPPWWMTAATRREEPIVWHIVDAQGGGGQVDVGKVAPAREEQATPAVARQRLEIAARQGDQACGR